MKKTVGEKSGKIRPRYVYDMLPKTNCKECGEERCMAFAEKVVTNQRKIEECPPLLRKRIRSDNKEKRRLLRTLEVENQVFTEEETFARTHNYGEVVARLLWPPLSSRKQLKAERHIIITTDGLVLMNQPIYSLKKRWKTLNVGERAFPLQKVIDYKNKETFSGLIPFKDPSSMHKVFPASPFFFEVKHIQDHFTDTPWITSMSGSTGTVLIGFDKGSLPSPEILDPKTPVELRVIDIPLNNLSKDSINSFINLLDDVKNKLDANEILSDPMILKTLRRRYCAKFQMEESLTRVEKRLTDYQRKFASQIPEETNSSVKMASKGTKTKKASKSRGTKRRKSKKVARKWIVWDTSHYEVLRWEYEVEELVALIQKATGLKVQWLKGSWKEQLLSDKQLLKKTGILVLTGIGSKGKIARNELTAITDFVKEGGSLFLSAPSFKGEDTNILANLFGVEFRWNKIRDKENHEGRHSDHAIISNFHSHPICEGIREFCFGDYGGFPLTCKQEVVPLAQSAESAQPPNAVVLATTQYGKGSILFASSSTTFKDKYLNMYDNKKLAENIFSYLATPPVTPDQPSHKEMAMKTPVAPAEEHPPATLKDTTDMPTLPNAEIAEKTPIEQETAIIEAPNTVVPEPQKAEQAIIPKAPAQSPAKVEQQIDKLDEQLAFGEIDETTYEVEKRKVKGDLTGLNQLMKEGRITLAKYMEAQVIIHSRSAEKPLKAQCSACDESLMGIETFCPNCGEKNQ